MKKGILLIVLALLAVGIFAQTGMFGISYGNSFSGTKADLKTKGFVETSSETWKTLYANPKIKNLKSLELRDAAEDGVVSGWTIIYDLSKDEKFFAGLVTELTALHGEPYEVLSSSYTWELEDGNAVFLDAITAEGTAKINYTVSDDYDDYWYWDEY